MSYDPDKHHRRSIRLKDYDYAQPGAYFVTICTCQRECFLGEIADGQVQLNECGDMVRAQWLSLPTYHLHVVLDEFVIMPNHLHGIIILTDADARAGLLTRPYKKRQGIPDLVRGFKTYSTRKINERRGSQGIPVWQRNYYEHIVRNEEELHAIQEYIVNNPLRWGEDQDHPDRWKSQDP